MYNKFCILTITRVFWACSRRMLIGMLSNYQPCPTNYTSRQLLNKRSTVSRKTVCIVASHTEIKCFPLFIFWTMLSLDPPYCPSLGIVWLRFNFSNPRNTGFDLFKSKFWWKISMRTPFFSVWDFHPLRLPQIPRSHQNGSARNFTSLGVIGMSIGALGPIVWLDILS